MGGIWTSATRCPPTTPEFPACMIPVTCACAPVRHHQRARVRVRAFAHIFACLHTCVPSTHTGRVASTHTGHTGHALLPSTHMHHDTHTHIHTQTQTHDRHTQTHTDHRHTQTQNETSRVSRSRAKTVGGRAPSPRGLGFVAPWRRICIGGGEACPCGAAPCGWWRCGGGEASAAVAA